MWLGYASSVQLLELGTAAPPWRRGNTAGCRTATQGPPWIDAPSLTVSPGGGFTGTSPWFPRAAVSLLLRHFLAF